MAKRRKKRSRVRTLPPEIVAAADNQIREIQREVAYDTRDFPVSVIVGLYQEGNLFVPQYQRNFIWLPKNRTRFIESVILGLPIPFMFLAELDDGRLEIVDGAQRIQTLEQFLNDDLRLSSLKKLTTLNGFRFSNLPISHQRKLKNRPLRFVILKEITSEELRQEIFGRINTSGVKAKPAEIRRGAYQGAFTEFISVLAKDEVFMSVCPISPGLLARRENEELVLRFIVYSDAYQGFKHDVDKYLDDFVAKRRNRFEAERIRSEFERTMLFVRAHFPSGFAKTPTARSTPRVRFEAIAVGVNLALRLNPGLEPGPIDWLDSEEFKELTTTHASNSRVRLKSRIEYVRDMLLRSLEQ